jgi:rubrerythrin
MQATMYTTGNEFTLKNLLAAYEGELNTHARYKAFALRADAEGFCGVGSLFRAAARAEQIHAGNQARVLRQMGGEATAQIQTPGVRSTLENLKDALAGEKYEIDTVYPPFIDQASAHINSTAARSFAWTLEAEKTHVRLYTEAIGLVEGGQTGSWISAARDFYVCPVCACTSEHKDAENCTICNYPSERLEAIR